MTFWQSLIVTATFLLVGLGVGLTYYILTSDNNPVAELIKVLGIFSLVISIVRPQTGIYILIVACAYLDLVKRIAYWFGYYSAANQGVATLQVSILSFAPVTVLGVFLGVLVRRIFITKRLIEKRELIAASFITLVNAAVLISNYIKQKDFIEAASRSANECIYLLLIFAAPSLYTTREDINKVLRFTLIAFLPCALYGIRQGVFGYTDLDVIWMKSGITVTESLLFDTKDRAFGTLASPHPYGVLYWMILIAGYFVYTSKRNRIFNLVLLFTYSVALFFGYTRSAWVSLAVTAGAIYFFKSGKKTIQFYSSALAVFAGFIIFAQYLYDHLTDFESILPIESSSSEMAFRLGTFSERLFSVQNWTTNSRFWTWFGMKEVFDYRAVTHDEIIHDMVGQVLVKYGAVGLFGGIGFASIALIYFHWATLRIKDHEDRLLAILLLSMVSINFYTGCIFGANYQVFPWNFFLWLSVGFQIVLCRLREGPPVIVKPAKESRLVAKPTRQGKPDARNYARSARR